MNEWVNNTLYNEDLPPQCHRATLRTGIIIHWDSVNCVQYISRDFEDNLHDGTVYIGPTLYSIRSM